MSTVFELDERGYDQALADARLEALQPQVEQGPGFFDNVLPATGEGIMRGGARVVQGAGLVGGALIHLAGVSEETQDAYFRGLDDYVNDAVDYWTPDAKTTGTAGRVLGGLGEIVLPLVAGGGNPATLIASQQAGTTLDLARQGVNPTTAVGVGTVQGVATAIGAKLPILGKTMGQRVFTSAVGNAGVNMAATFAQRRALEANGYEELAKNYDPLDVEGRTVDLLIGAAFGFLPQGESGATIAPSDRAAILAAANARHFQVDTAPGRPLDAEASAAHQNAMETALRQLLDGEPVSVDPAVTTANFEPRPAREVVVPEELKDFEANRNAEPPPRETPPPTDTIPRDSKLSAEDRAIESRFAEQISKDIDGQIEAYSKLPDSHGGKVINTDIVRELSPDYLADRSKSGAVHEPASFLTKEIYKRALAKAPPGGEVVFASGGAGSGKSSGLKLLGIKDQIIYDGTLSKLTSAIKLIDQALAAKQTARIMFTYRDAAESLSKGALSRSMGEIKKHGSGRTVPLHAFEEGHVGARHVFGQLLEKYGLDDRVRFDVIDNTRGPNEARRVKFDDLPMQEYNGLREKLDQILEEQRTSGAISEAVYRGFSGAGKGERGRVLPEGRGKPEPQRQGGSSDGVTDERVFNPAIEGAKQLLADRDIDIPTAEVDADGNAVVRSGRELMAEAEAGIVKAEADAKGYEAAVSCILTRGLDDAA